MLQQCRSTPQRAQDSDHKVKIEWGISKNRDAVAVIQTMDVNQPRVQSLVEELDLGGADSLLAGDRLPKFSLATRINSGIQRASEQEIEQENIRCIILRTVTSMVYRG